MFAQATLPKSLILLSILCVIFLTHASLSFRVPNAILSSYTTFNNTGAVESVKHKLVGDYIYFTGVFRIAINISPNITLKHPKYINDECNLFVAKMDLYTQSIIWYKSEILEHCSTSISAVETSVEDGKEVDYLAISLNTPWPCCDFLHNGGPGFIVYNATSGQRLFAEQMVVYYGSIDCLAFDSNSLYLAGYVGDSNYFGIEVFRDEDSPGKIYNTFIRKYNLNDWKPQWLVQSIDTNLPVIEGASPRKVTGLFSTSINGTDLIVVSGQFFQSDSTTWRDSNRNLLTVQKKDGMNNGNYILIFYKNGTLISHISTRIGSYSVKRRDSLVLCGSNSVLECQEFSLPNLETKNVMVSNQFGSSCQATVHSIAGTDSLVFISAKFGSCRNNELVVQALDPFLRDSVWNINVTASEVKSTYLSTHGSTVMISYVYSGLFMDIVGRMFSFPRLTLVMQAYSTDYHTSCFGIAYNDSSVCSGHGFCQSSDYCVCNYGYGNANCSQFTCFGKLENGCNSGKCVAIDTCECSGYYSGPHCNVTTCYGILSTNESFVCGGKGKCLDYNFCNCDVGYSGNNCSSFMCHDISSTSDKVCSGRGKCASIDQCICQENYFGEKCDLTTCYGIDSNNFTVCQRSGLCVSHDNCECLPNRVGPECTIPTCYSKSILSNDSVCSANGDCLAIDNCVCKQYNNSLPMYVGKQCETPVCFGNIGIESCSGQGECVGPNNCSCHDGFSGKLCNVDEDLLYKILIPVGLVVSSLVFFLLVSVALYLYKNRYWNKRKKTEQEMEQKLLDIELELEDERSKQFSYLIPIEELELIEKIGSGGFGQVYKARWKQVHVAVKSVDNRNTEEETLEDEEDTFEREVLLLNSLKHPNVIQFFGVCLTDRRKLMVMEYLGGGSLDKIINELRLARRKIKLLQKLQILFGVSNGLGYLHNLKPKTIIHRDLKSANILLDENMQPKVCDFGLSKLVGNNNNTSMTTNLGSIFYMAELIGDNNIAITNKLDVYSFGIVMYELLFEDNPFLNQNSQKIHRFSKPEISDINSFSIPLKVSKGFRPKIPFSTNEERSTWINDYMKDDLKYSGMNIIQSVLDQYIDLMKDCWDQNPDNRPSFDEIADRLANIISKLHL